MTNQIWLVNAIVDILRGGEQEKHYYFHKENRLTQLHIPAHTGKMKAKNRDQSLSDSRELDGSYDQLTGE